MKRRFADLHLKVPPVKLVGSAPWVKALGVDAVALTIDEQRSEAEVSATIAALSGAGVEPHLRLDIFPDRPGRPLRDLKALRVEYDLIAGVITSTRALRALLRSEVDLLLAETADPRVLGPSSFRSIARADKSFEVNLRPLITSKGPGRTAALREFSRQVRLAAEAGLKLILSSGAVDAWEMRPPRETANILVLLGFDAGEALGTVSSNPFRVLEEASQPRRDGA